MKFRNVIFDLDGTLLDTSAGIIESVLYTVGKMNLKPLSEPELRSFIGPPLRRSFKEICGCAEDEASEAVRVFRAFYQAGAVLHASPYDGMEKLCRTLSEAGVRTGAATNKPERFASALIVNFGLDRYIHPVFGADENGTFYYHYDEFNEGDPNGTQPSTRNAYYTTDPTLSSDGGKK